MLTSGLDVTIYEPRHPIGELWPLRLAILASFSSNLFIVNSYTVTTSHIGVLKRPYCAPTEWSVADGQAPYWGFIIRLRRRLSGQGCLIQRMSSASRPLTLAAREVWRLLPHLKPLWVVRSSGWVSDLEPPSSLPCLMTPLSAQCRASVIRCPTNCGVKQPSTVIYSV